eukprot:scaffold296889_cov26-Tisochrysis_lutea.AAC.4
MSSTMGPQSSSVLRGRSALPVGRNLGMGTTDEDLVLHFARGGAHLPGGRVAVLRIVLVAEGRSHHHPVNSAARQCGHWGTHGRKSMRESARRDGGSGRAKKSNGNRRCGGGAGEG